jgi:peroxiredoxin
MICIAELRELERQHGDFDQKQVKLYVISNDDLTAAKQTQAEMPHLIVLSDADQSAARALQLIHPRASNTGEDTNAPTTILVDDQGKVRWIARNRNFLQRFTTKQLLDVIDQHRPTS